MSDPCGQVLVFFYSQGPEIGFDSHQGIQQGGLACCILLSHEESDTTERMNCVYVKFNLPVYTPPCFFLLTYICNSISVL